MHLIIGRFMFHFILHNCLFLLFNWCSLIDEVWVRPPSLKSLLCPWLYCHKLLACRSLNEKTGAWVGGYSICAAVHPMLEAVPYRSQTTEYTSTWVSLSAKHVLAAHHETPPQSSLLCISLSFSFHNGPPGKVSQGEESSTSAIVENTLLWIWFPVF